MKILTDKEFEECHLLIGDALTYYFENRNLRCDHPKSSWLNLQTYKEMMKNVVSNEHIVRRIKDFTVDEFIQSIDDSPDEGYDWNSSWDSIRGKLLGEQTTIVTSCQKDSKA